MSFFSEEVIEEVRSRNEIVAVIGRYVKLKRSGSGFIGLCPFHSEKTPSFSVNPDRQIFKCFGCGIGGSVFTFIMEYENFSFPEAVTYLAEQSGMELSKKELSEEEKRKESLRATLIEINTKAATFYYKMLKSEKGNLGYEYLRSRGLSDKTITHFGLGYAGDGTALYGYLKHQGYSDSVLKETGLFKMDERGAYDKFWNRVMFPIMDISSHVIGFGGRVMGDAKPKYLNSPETQIFDKSRNLFGLNFAKQGKSRNIILCEGYMDVIAMHQAGFTNAVASLGTAFTEQQANLLRRYTEEVLLLYDSDEAGVKAALRAIPILRGVGLRSKVVHLEPYKDPDEFIKAEGTEEFEKRLSAAQNTFFFEVNVLKKNYQMSDPDQKTKFIHEIAKKLLIFTDKVQRDSYLEAIAAEEGIKQENLRNLVIQYGSQMPEGYSAQEAVTNRKKKQQKEQDRGISYSYQLYLSWLIEYPEIYPAVRDKILIKDFCEEQFREVAEMLYEQLEHGELIPAKIINRFTEVESQRMVAQMFQTGYQTELSCEEREKAFNELIIRIKEYSIDYHMRNLTDMNELQGLISEKKRWQQPEKMHISLKDG